MAGLFVAVGGARGHKRLGVFADWYPVAQVPLRTDIAPAIGGAADWDKITVIDVEKLPEEFRFHRLVFKAAGRTSGCN